MLQALLLTILSLREDVLLRKAWEAALRNNSSDTARQLYPKVRDRAWVARPGFHHLYEFARTLPPEESEALLTAAAKHDPSVVLRRTDLDPRILQVAALQAPAEAVGIAAGSSPTSQFLRKVLPPRLATLAADAAIDVPTRQRLAILGDNNIADARDNRRYFARITARKPIPREAIEFAQSLVRDLRQAGIKQVAHWSPAERYLLAVYGREELDAPTFTRLVPSAPPAGPRYRAFLSDAVQFGHPTLIRAQSLAQALQGIAAEDNPLQETLFAANILDALAKPQRPQAAALLKSAYEKAGPYAPLYGLLIAHLAQRLPSNATIASSYAHYLQAPQSISTAPVFSHNGTSLHRYYFYDDDDGVESYETFLAAYRKAPNWTTVKHANWVHLTGVSGKRRIEIFANIPRKPDADAVIRKAMQNREPDVLVHRGHAFHLDKTLRRLNSTARLVFLGSCRGMEAVATVIDTAPQAQMFATRGTGTHTINDPILKALNNALLTAGDKLDWQSFWGTQKSHFKSNSLFADYIPPHQNTQAILLRAWYAFLSEPEPNVTQP
ncbi:MAG: hypothetical protein HY820_36970 [Acidobacteria bacterium]|nr:hypothetical protein [Acidobacteriota bacterium]